MNPSPSAVGLKSRTGRNILVYQVVTVVAGDGFAPASV